jgi:hypothetical protein
VDRTFYGEPYPYLGEPIRCQYDHGAYVHSRGGVAMSGGDRRDSSTRVPVVRCV